MASVETKVPSITFAASSVRLACAIRKMVSTESLQTLASIKDEAKSKLLPRDLLKLKVAYEARQKTLRNIPAEQTDTNRNQ